jgi:hypothetical protein
MQWPLRIFILIFFFGSTTGYHVFAEEVGIVSAVNPSAHGQPPGLQTKILELGEQLIFKEHLKTDANGSLQIAFLDKSTLSVGPNSDLTIDEFVYSPSTNQGKMTLTITKGVMRFVGGEVSHAGNAEIKTPTATIGLRGAAGTISVNSSGDSTYNHLFGKASVKTIDGSVVVARPGFSISLPAAMVVPSPPVRTQQSAITEITSSTTSKPGQQGGLATKITEAKANGQLESKIADANPRKIKAEQGTEGSDSSDASDTNFDEAVQDIEDQENRIAVDSETTQELFSNITTACDCSYTKWGFWNDTSYTESTNDSDFKQWGNSELWVFGYLTDTSTIPSTGSATFAGHAVASITDLRERVSTSSAEGSTYYKGSNFSGTVDFAARTGTVSISDLDGMAYTGAITSSSNSISGTLTTSSVSTGYGTNHTVSGTLSGSFYGPAAAEMGGQFSASSNVSVSGTSIYSVSGVFLGKQ